MRFDEITEAQYASQGLYDVYINGKRSEQVSGMTREEADRYIESKLDMIYERGTTVRSEHTRQGVLLTIGNNGGMTVEIKPAWIVKHNTN